MKRMFRIATVIESERHNHENPDEGSTEREIPHESVLASAVLTEITAQDPNGKPRLAWAQRIDKESARVLAGPEAVKNPEGAATIVTGMLFNGFLDASKKIAGETGMLLGAESLRASTRDALIPFFVE